MIPRLTAVRFDRFMGSGRTSPVLCACEDSLGNPVGDLVLKLRGGMEDGITGSLCELLASRLASYFGMAVPAPAIVTIEEEFAKLVASLDSTGTDSTKINRMRNSVGPNFGSRLIAGVNTWPVDKSIPEAMVQAATEVFAFDSLVQDPDRRYNNPNLLTRGDEIFLIDHEMAFCLLAGNSAIA